jgi:hypothetical protein
MPDALVALFERGASILFNLFSVAGLVVAAVNYFARLDPAIGELDRKVVDVRATQVEANSRVDRIEDSRTLDVQRLSKAEEAIGSVKDTLAKIDAKVDRLLMRSR